MLSLGCEDAALWVQVNLINFSALPPRAASPERLVHCNPPPTELKLEFLAGLACSAAALSSFPCPSRGFLCPTAFPCELGWSWDKLPLAS